MIILYTAAKRQALLFIKRLNFSRSYCTKESDRDLTLPAGVPGAGVGKGGGAGGSVRESGGGLGKYGAAQEEGYFHHKQREQLEKIKKQMKDGTFELGQKPEEKT